MINHPISPVYDENSKILILGSFPSVKSREYGFFYGHPKNRFWCVLAGVLKCSVPVTVDEKKKMMIDYHIALWDVVQSCDIVGSSDNSIKNVVPNDISIILKTADIKRIITNGKKADVLYRKYIEPKTKIKAVCLPSTSPANAAFSAEKLITIWTNAIEI